MSLETQIERIMEVVEYEVVRIEKVTCTVFLRAWNSSPQALILGFSSITSVVQKLRDRAGRGETARSLRATISALKFRRKDIFVNDEKETLRKLRSQGFKDGYMGNKRAHDWSSDYREGYAKGAASGRCQRGEEEALQLEALYRGKEVEEMTAGEILEFSHRYHERKTERAKNGVEDV